MLFFRERDPSARSNVGCKEKKIKRDRSDAITNGYRN